MSARFGMGWRRRGSSSRCSPEFWGGNFASADVFVPDAKLIVLVDGPGHMEEGVRSVYLQAQLLKDHKFNARALHRGYRVLRLHYQDIEWGDMLRYCAAALRFCKRFPQRAFLMYSKRYRVLGFQPRGL